MGTRGTDFIGLLESGELLYTFLIQMRALVMPA